MTAPQIIIIIGLILMLIDAVGGSVPRVSLWKLGIVLIVGAVLLGQGIRL
jgi:hypothetical protein